tara:strand:- start:15 stop:809 length:795 start_codon:yes stop_codon:yes gene_type:complete
VRTIRSFFILGFFIFLLSGCGLIGVIENNTAMKEPARRKMIDAVSELRVSSKINSSTSPFFRLKGSGQISSDQQKTKVRLDFRIKSQDPSEFWLDVSDQFMGIKLARMLATNDSIKGYANILNKYIDVPTSRIKQLGIPLNVEDIINIFLGEVIAWPEDFLLTNMDFSSEVWSLNFPVRRDTFLGEISLEFSSDNDHKLLSQKLEITQESLIFQINYRDEGSFDLTISTPKINGKLDFRAKSKKSLESLEFPFNIPSHHARMDF